MTWHKRSKYALVTVQRDGDRYIVSGIRLDRLPAGHEPDDDYLWRFRADEQAHAAGGYRATAPVCECTWTEVDYSRGELGKRPTIERQRTPCRRGVSVPATANPSQGLRPRGRCPEADKGTVHGQRFCHGGFGRRHLEHMIELAEAVLDSYGSRNGKPSQPVARGDDSMMELDGQERTEVRPVEWRKGGLTYKREPIKWAWWCYSRRCARPYPESLEPNGEAETEQAAYDARNAHVQWHRERYGISGRLLLDDWIRDHAMVSVAEPDRAELNCQLALAKAGA